MRHDVYVGNDAGAWSLLSSSVVEEVVEDYGRNAGTFFEKQRVIGSLLVGDQSLLVRVVEGEPLTDEEREQWVAHFRWGLHVPCGRLLVTGGFDADVLAAWRDEGGNEDGGNPREVAVSPGHYLVDVYTYLPTMNGRAFCRDVWKEKLGAWFRRDHPARAFPSWVAAELLRSPEGDPGHEDDWGDVAASVRSGKLVVETDVLDWVGFLVHLQPWDDAAALSTPEDPGGWFGAGQGLRRPEGFPLGVPAHAKDASFARHALRPLIGKEEDARPLVQCQPADVLSTTDKCPLLKIEGGPVAVPLKQLPLVYRLAWFATAGAQPEWRVIGKDAAGLARRFGSRPDLMVARGEGDVLRIGFAQKYDTWFTQFEVFDELDDSAWTGLPAGSLLESAAREEDEEAGLMRFRGPTSGSGDGAIWAITESFPPVAAPTLREALALVEAAKDPSSLVLRLRSPEEAQQVLERFVGEWDWVLDLENDRPRRDGAGILFEEPQRRMMYAVAASAFCVRYDDVWRNCKSAR
jgi:hypothetical protein